MTNISINTNLNYNRILLITSSKDDIFRFLYYLAQNNSHFI